MVDFSRIIEAQKPCDRDLVCRLLATIYKSVSGEETAIDYDKNKEIVTVKIGQGISQIRVVNDSDLGFFWNIVESLK